MSEYNMDLLNYIDPAETALVGRENGKTLRKTLQTSGVDLLKKEESFQRINISIPETIVTMNKSFFLGAFADRVRALGKNGFEEKYHFQTSEHIQNKISSHIEYALKDATPEEILNVKR